MSTIGGLALTADAPPLVQKTDRHVLKLPVPHPLDFDWRFTAETINDLLRLTEDLSRNGAHGLCFLGAPSLFRASIEHGIRRPFSLIDASAACAAALKGVGGKIFVTNLLTDPLPEVRAELVVADPPWYEEFVRSFLWAASQIVLLGGTVLLSFPPVGTRPGIEEEWRRTEKFAHGLGLTLREKSLSLKYLSPPFEQNALRAAHHQYVQPDWRPGVLVVFQKTGECCEPRPTNDNLHLEWTEQSLLGVRWRFRPQQQPIECRPLLVEAVAEDILDSVSRRDPRRAKADVWTSGNRIFASPDTRSLELITKALASGAHPDTFLSEVFGRKLIDAERQEVLRIAKQVATITAHELREYLMHWEE